ncbi:MAG: cell division protein ZapA [Eubacteriaceae bacterium]|jgi:cell division protein ZapA|nr:cell division protein ZapA [Eubacteriaceae bacterium]
MNEKRQISISILDTDYQILTDDSESRVNEIAGFVDKKIRQTKAAAPHMTNLSAAILAALNLSEELFKAKDEAVLLREREDDLQALFSYKDKLKTVMQQLSENDSLAAGQQQKIDKLQTENNELIIMLNEYKEKYNSVRAENEINKRSVSELENKLLENQIELVKARKTLLDFGD